MTPPGAASTRPASEAELVRRTARWLEGEGYRTYANPDGADYFDLVARRGEEVGLVEAKLGRPRAVLGQALRRRAWGDWVAVVLPSRQSAERLVGADRRPRAEPVGVWWLDGERVVELRPARPFDRGDDDPFAPTRARFRLVLDRIDRGELPSGIAWEGLGAELRRASGGRRFAEWRLDERFDQGD